MLWGSRGSGAWGDLAPLRVSALSARTVRLSPLTAAAALVSSRSVEAYDEDQFASVATAMIKHVARMLNLPLEQAGAMLGVYSWDAQALIDAFMSAPEAVAARCGVSLSNAGALSLKRFADGLERSSALASPTGSRAPVHRLMQLLGLRSAPPPAPAAAPHEDDAQDMCGACLEEVPRWRLVSLGCGHDMCDGCWRRHLAASLEEHGKRVHVRVSSARRQTQARNAPLTPLALPADPVPRARLRCGRHAGLLGGPRGEVRAAKVPPVRPPLVCAPDGERRVVPQPEVHTRAPLPCG